MADDLPTMDAPGVGYVPGIEKMPGSAPPKQLKDPSEVEALAPG